MALRPRFGVRPWLRRQDRDSPTTPGALPLDQPHVEDEVGERRVDAERGRVVGVAVADRVHDQLLLDGERGVGAEVLVAGDEHVRGDRPVARGLDPVVDVGRAHRVPPHRAQHLAARPVGGDRVAGRDDAAEPVAAVGVRGEQPAQVAQVLGGVLGVVVAGVVGLPDVEDGAGDRLAVGVGDPAAHDHDLGALPLGTLGDPVAVAPGGSGGVERALDRRRRGVRAADEVDVVDGRGQAEHVREQDELVAVLAGDLAGADEEAQPGEPLLGRRPGLAHEGVQVADQRGDQLVEPRVVALDLAEDGLQQGVEALVAEGVRSRHRGSPVGWGRPVRANATA
jgi:hypothetical protein